MLCIFWALPWYFRLKSDSCLNIIFKLSLSINKLLMFWGFLKTWVSSDLLRLNSLLFMWIHFSTYFCDGKDFNLSSSFLVVFFWTCFSERKRKLNLSSCSIATSKITVVYVVTIRCFIGFCVWTIMNSGLYTYIISLVHNFWY